MFGFEASIHDFCFFKGSDLKKTTTSLLIQNHLAYNPILFESYHPHLVPVYYSSKKHRFNCWITFISHIRQWNLSVVKNFIDSRLFPVSFLSEFNASSVEGVRFMVNQKMLL